MAQPRVGIVVPVYNGGRFLVATLESVLAQSFADWRCVIVDNGSRDDSAAIAERFAAADPRFSVRRQPGNIGVCRARGEGAEAVGGEFLIFLDGDDLWRPDALATLVAAAEANPDAPAVHASATFIDAAGAPLTRPALDERLRRLVLRDGAIVEPARSEPTTPAMLATWPSILTPGLILVRRAAFARAGGWNASLSIGEDWELWYRLSLLGPIPFVDRTVIAYRIHAGSASGTWKRSLRLRAAREHVIRSPRATPEQRAFAARAFRVMSRRLGVGRLVDGVRSLTRGQVKPAAKGLMLGAINVALGLLPRRTSALAG